MNWAALYLGCFVVGLLLTLVSLLAGSVHVHLPHLHIGHGGGHGGGHGTGPSIHVHSAGTHGAHAQVPIINFASVVAFLAWFGATGYLLTHFHPVQVLVALVLAIIGGLAGFGIVLWFLTKLASHDNTMQSADYDMIGVLGKVNVSIRPGGTGEIIFSLAGTRRCCGARSDDSNSAIAKGEEVVVTRYEGGLAYVKKWEELAGSHEPQVEEKNSAGAS